MAGHKHVRDAGLSDSQAESRERDADRSENPNHISARHCPHRRPKANNPDNKLVPECHTQRHAVADDPAGAENPIRPLCLEFLRMFQFLGCGGTIEPTWPSRWSCSVTRCRSSAVRYNALRY
jgi:hypothetical protein